MTHHTSRKYQSYLHISGILYSFLTIFGAILVGKNNYTIGITIMVIGAILARISSELEYRKQSQLFKEFREKR